MKKLLSIRAYAKLKGVSDAAIRKPLASGLLKLHGKKIDTEEADAALKQGLDPGQVESGNSKLAKLAGNKAAAKPNGKWPEMVSLYEARTARANFSARREKIAVEREKMELEKAQGKLIDRQVFIDQFAQLVIAARTRFLEIPSKLAPQMAAEEDPVVCQALLDQAITEALEELGNYGSTQRA